jgi:lycopene cyclase domain-containing protein
MSSYLLINIVVIAIPLLFSFERKVRFYRRLPAVAASIGIVGGVYLVWDVIATARGDWAFSEDHTIGFSILGLPIEEILFFVTVPYACIFLYETLRAYLPDGTVPLYRWWYGILSIVLIATAFFFTDQPYTFTVLLFNAAFFILSLFFYRVLLGSRLYWLFMGISFVPFFTVNYILTSVPIVTYNPEAFWGIRITTIPAEDFLYSFSLLSFTIAVYRIVLDRWIEKRV